MMTIATRTCRNGRTGLDLHDLRSKVGDICHMTIGSGLDDVEAMKTCVQIIDGYDWKDVVYFDTKEEAEDAAKKCLDAAKQIVIASETTRLEKSNASIERLIAKGKVEMATKRAERNAAAEQALRGYIESDEYIIEEAQATV